MGILLESFPETLKDSSSVIPIRVGNIQDMFPEIKLYKINQNI